jgi:threonine/homoserine/homoserine lactone efflux protein
MRAIFSNTAAAAPRIVSSGSFIGDALMSILFSMAAFALASSISPGPVNIVALGSGARHGLRASMRHVTGATVGFTLLLLLTGLGLHELLARLPALTRTIQLAGVAFLLYMAWKLARDDGALDLAASGRGPSLMAGAAMQWLNPKAWVASVAGMGAFAADGDAVLVWQFAALYFVVCYGSIACWAYAGTLLRSRLSDASGMRLFNRAMALLLAVSAVCLLLSGDTGQASPPAIA